MDISKLSTKFSSYGISFITHALIIITLCVAVVVVPQVVPQPPMVEIGEQIKYPEALTVSGTPDAEVSDAAPPSGTVDPQEEQDASSVKNPESMIKPFDKPPAAEETKAPSEGLPGEPSKAAQPVEGIFGPAREGKPGIDNEGIPMLFGEPIRGKTVFVLDTSGSMDSFYRMGLSRLDALRIELINCIGLMNDLDEFDIIVYDGYRDDSSNHCVHLWGELKIASEENKQAAIDWLANLRTGGSTPTYEALEYACGYGPDDLDNLLLLTDGFPDSHSESELQKAKKWFEHFEECKFVCVSIGEDGLGFVLILVDAVGGVYTVVE